MGRTRIVGASSWRKAQDCEEIKVRYRELTFCWEWVAETVDMIVFSIYFPIVGVHGLL